MKNKLLIPLIIGLIVSNGLLIGIIITKKPPHLKNRNPKEIVIQRLQFNSNQIEDYSQLVEEHRKLIRASEEALNSAKNKLYQLLNDKTGPNGSDSIINIIATTHTEIEKLHYQHFKEIGTLCNPDQLESYNELTKELINIFSKKPPKK
jgi:periplasmic protein CpxP/Spy